RPRPLATPASSHPTSSSRARDLAESTASSREEPVHSATSRAVDGSDGHRAPVAVRSPLVRRLARDLGVDVHTITGSGADGAITRTDVLRAAVDTAVDEVTAPPTGIPASDPTSASAPSAGDALDGLAVISRERMSPLRKAVSAKLS